MTNGYSTDTNDHLGEIEQYLVGYGDDYGALSSTNTTHITNTNRTSSLKGNHGSIVAGIDFNGGINTINISRTSETDGAHDPTEQSTTKLTSKVESTLDGFQLSIQANREAEISLNVCCKSVFLIL